MLNKKLMSALQHYQVLYVLSEIGPRSFLLSGNFGSHDDNQSLCHIRNHSVGYIHREDVVIISYALYAEDEP
jgi:hypothetical protein